MVNERAIYPQNEENTSPLNYATENGTLPFMSNIWTPRIMQYISYLHHISFALHLKNLPCQHEMHATSQFKCNALHLHFVK